MTNYLISNYHFSIPIVYPIHAILQLELIFHSKDLIFETFQNTYNFIEMFPKQEVVAHYCFYLNTYRDVKQNYDFKMDPGGINDIEPRLYWQWWLSSRPYINLNTYLMWLWTYPERWEDQNTVLLINYLNGLNFTHPEEYDVIFYKIYKGVYPFRYSVYDISYGKEALQHHDFSTKYVLTTNFYIGGLSGSYLNHLSGLYLCYFEPTANWEVYVFPLPSYVIENYLSYHKIFFGDPSMNIAMLSDFFKYYNKIRYYNALQELYWLRLYEDLHCSYIFKTSEDVE